MSTTGDVVFRAKCPECPMEEQAQALQSIWRARVHTDLLCGDTRARTPRYSCCPSRTLACMGPRKEPGKAWGLWFLLVSSSATCTQ